MRLFVIAALFAVTPALWAQDTEPAWLSYERGMHAYRSGEFGQALRQFRLALERQPVFPEATAAIGRVYLQDRSFALAERYFLEALAARAQFYVPEDAYAVSYELAAMYAIDGSYKRLIDTLEDVVSDHALSEDTQENRNLKTSYLRTIRLEGLDRLATLFRLDLDFSYRAYADAGTFYVRTARYDEAVLYLSIASLQALSTIVTEIRTVDLEYEYESLAELLSLVEGDRRLVSFSERVELYRVLYYLAGALYGDGSAVRAREVWAALAASPIAGEYRRRAGIQLQSPDVEPLIEL